MYKLCTRPLILEDANANEGVDEADMHQTEIEDKHGEHYLPNSPTVGEP
jgi:hypothetical protein